MELTLKELRELVLTWAKIKGINNPDNQYLKCIEEIGETAGAILKGKREDILNEIGDIAVTVIILYWQKNKFISDKIYTYDTEDEYSVEEKRTAIQQILLDLDEQDESILDSIELLAVMHNSDLVECLTLAWNKIKNRQGKTVDGTFIKSAQ